MDNAEKFLKAHELLLSKCYRESFEIFQALSRDSYTMADHFLAWMYEQGLGVDKNKEKAFEYYMFSAKSGNGVSQCGVGTYYLKGDVVAQDFIQAYYWFSLSVKCAEENPEFECGAKAELKKLQSLLTKSQLNEACKMLKCK